jgi:hypothetical protein
MRDRILSVALDVVGRVFLRRDRLNGEMRRLFDAFALDQERLTIRRGTEICLLCMFGRAMRRRCF